MLIKMQVEKVSEKKIGARFRGNERAGIINRNASLYRNTYMRLELVAKY